MITGGLARLAYHWLVVTAFSLIAVFGRDLKRPEDHKVTK